MIDNSIKQFCMRWSDKADKYTEKTTEDVFDRFFSLFVAYNTLYSEITIMLEKKNMHKGTGDRVSATQNVPKYIGQAILFDKLKNLSGDIDKIVNLIKNGTFYISTKRDNITPDTAKDNKYIDNIENINSAQNLANKTKFNEAVLSLIYGVRCNMFHGKKGFDPIQKELLIPMNNILEMLIKDLLLNDDKEAK